MTLQSVPGNVLGGRSLTVPTHILESDRDSSALSGGIGSAFQGQDAYRAGFFLSRHRLMRITLVFSLLLAVLTVVFALQNDDPMAVDFLFFNTQGSTALVLIVTFTLGVVVGLLSTLPGRIRDRRKLNKIQGSNDPSGPSAIGSAGSSSPSARRSTSQASGSEPSRSTPPHGTSERSNA